MKYPTELQLPLLLLSLSGIKAASGTWRTEHFSLKCPSPIAHHKGRIFYFLNRIYIDSRHGEEDASNGIRPAAVTRISKIMGVRCAAVYVDEKGHGTNLHQPTHSESILYLNRSIAELKAMLHSSCPDRDGTVCYDREVPGPCFKPRLSDVDLVSGEVFEAQEANSSLHCPTSLIYNIHKDGSELNQTESRWMNGLRETHKVVITVMVMVILLLLLIIAFLVCKLFRSNGKRKSRVSKASSRNRKVSFSTPLSQLNRISTAGDYEYQYDEDVKEEAEAADEVHHTTTDAEKKEEEAVIVCEQLNDNAYYDPTDK